MAARGLALAQAAFDMAKDYMQSRHQFGRPIASNQYLAFKMADLQTEIDMARLLLYQGVWEQQQGMDFSISASKAKLACSNLAMRITTECVQNVDGSGYMREPHVDRMFRDVKIAQIADL